MSDLPAGRKLDALIAEKVMGLEKVAPHRQGFDGRSGWHDDYGFGDGYVRNPPKWPQEPRFPEDYNFQRVPPYSTDIAAAWDVVEKLGNWHGFDFLVWRTAEASQYHEGDWQAGWYEAGFDGPESRASAYAKTAPIAICRAALKAVGHE